MKTFNPSKFIENFLSRFDEIFYFYYVGGVEIVGENKEERKCYRIDNSTFSEVASFQGKRDITLELSMYCLNSEFPEETIESIKKQSIFVKNVEDLYSTLKTNGYKDLYLSCPHPIDNDCDLLSFHIKFNI